MNHRTFCLGFVSLCIALSTTLAGCPKQDAKLEPEPNKELVPLPPCLVDIDCDDGNPCTVDACNGTTLSCDSSPLDNVVTPKAPQSECLKHMCVMGVDSVFPADYGTSIAMQIAGDCHVVVCDGMGGETTIEDNQDVNVDGLECTTDICDVGNPRNIKKPDGTACGAGLQCNNGQCAGCLTNQDCSAGATQCTDAVCASGSCQSEAKPNGTRLPSAGQTAGDCKVWVCDGNGNTKEVADPMDPQNDGNACTLDTCNGTIPTHSPASAGTTCMGNLLCNGAGSCGGALGDSCTSNVACVSGFCVDGVCCNTACTADCQSCDVAGSVGTCSNTPFYETDGTCGGTNVCNGNGACLLKNGENCAGGGDHCASGYCKATLCKGSAGQPCSADKGCTSGQCTNGTCE